MKVERGVGRVREPSWGSIAARQGDVQRRVEKCHGIRDTDSERLARKIPVQVLEHDKDQMFLDDAYICLVEMFILVYRSQEFIIYDPKWSSPKKQCRSFILALLILDR